MKPAWRVARIAGIDLRVHVTFPLLLLWVAFNQYLLRSSAADVAIGMILTLLLFAVVILHELGHAFMARRFGIRTRDITLLPIGGVARLDRIPTKPIEELLVALAGPAVNLVLAVGLLSVFGWRHALASADFVPAEPAEFLAEFGRANLWLAAFNLLPVFPLDGGRILRALLALRFERVRATRIALQIGRAGAILLGLAGLAINPLLVLVAVFIWIAAAAETEADLLEAAVAGLHVEEVMLRDCHTFGPNESLARATNHLLATSQEDFPVVDRDGRLLGMLRRADLLQGLAVGGPQGFINDVMLRQIPTARADETVAHLLRRWPADQTTVAVLRDNRFAGLLTGANLGEFLMVKSSLRQHAGEPPAPVLPLSVQSPS